MNTIKIDSITSGLKEYIRSKGGIISIGKFYQVQGWWRASEMLSGRMATPDDIFLLEYKEREFVKYPCDDITLYIEKEYVDAQKKIEFIIPDEGTFEITIRKPEKRKKKKAW